MSLFKRGCTYLTLFQNTRMKRNEKTFSGNLSTGSFRRSLVSSSANYIDSDCSFNDLDLLNGYMDKETRILSDVFASKLIIHKQYQLDKVDKYFVSDEGNNYTEDKDNKSLNRSFFTETIVIDDSENCIGKNSARIKSMIEINHDDFEDNIMEELIIKSYEDDDFGFLNTKVKCYSANEDLETLRSTINHSKNYFNNLSETYTTCNSIDFLKHTGRRSLEEHFINEQLKDDNENSKINLKANKSFNDVEEFVDKFRQNHSLKYKQKSISQTDNQNDNGYVLDSDEIKSIRRKLIDPLFDNILFHHDNVSEEILPSKDQSELLLDGFCELEFNVDSMSKESILDGTLQVSKSNDQIVSPKDDIGKDCSFISDHCILNHENDFFAENKNDILMNNERSFFENNPTNQNILGSSPIQNLQTNISKDAEFVEICISPREESSSFHETFTLPINEASKISNDDPHHLITKKMSIGNDIASIDNIIQQNLTVNLSLESLIKDVEEEVSKAYAKNEQINEDLEKHDSTIPNTGTIMKSEVSEQTIKPMIIKGLPQPIDESLISTAEIRQLTNSTHSPSSESKDTKSVLENTRKYKTGVTDKPPNLVLGTKNIEIINSFEVKKEENVTKSVIMESIEKSLNVPEKKENSIKDHASNYECSLGKVNNLKEIYHINLNLESNQAPNPTYEHNLISNHLINLINEHKKNVIYNNYYIDRCSHEVLIEDSVDKKNVQVSPMEDDYHKNFEKENQNYHIKETTPSFPTKEDMIEAYEEARNRIQVGQQNITSPFYYRRFILNHEVKLEYIENILSLNDLKIFHVLMQISKKGRNRRWHNNWFLLQDEKIICYNNNVENISPTNLLNEDEGDIRHPTISDSFLKHKYILKLNEVRIYFTIDTRTGCLGRFLKPKTTFLDITENQIVDITKNKGYKFVLKHKDGAINTHESINLGIMIRDNQNEYHYRFDDITKFLKWILSVEMRTGRVQWPLP